MCMNVNLPPSLEEMVRAKVGSGMYASVSEVVREALRLMEEQDRLRQLKLDELRHQIRKGFESDLGEPWDAAAIKQKAEGARPSFTEDRGIDAPGHAPPAGRDGHSGDLGLHRGGQCRAA